MAMLQENHPRVFRTMYKPEIRRLVREDSPVYSWMFIGDEYRLLVSSLSEVLPIAPSFDPALTSRIEQKPPPGIGQSYTVVDTDKLDGMTTTQLGDYLTLQIMLEFRPGELEQAPGDSILNLFYVDDPEIDAPAEMSPLDREMLTQVYSNRRTLASASALRNGIAANMINTLDADGLIQN